MNFNKIFAFALFAVNFTSNLCAQTVTDADGNIYSTVTIGNQVWMGENLRATKFNNLDNIPLVLDSAQWGTQNAAAYCYYNNDTSYVTPYGNLYNWNTVIDIRNVCPTGYHIPTSAEWADLVNYLGGETVAGGKLKEIGFTHWLSPNTDADNSSGFTALPSGWRAYNNGVYENLQYMCYLWSSTAQTATDADIVLIGYDSPALYGSYTNKLTGLPIRCLQNSGATGINELRTNNIEIYPNPADDIINLKISDLKSDLNFVIYDALGRIVNAGIINAETTSLDISNLATGFYIIKAGNQLQASFIKK
jgi:uncharacterized protein (TIGR02145 family)